MIVLDAISFDSRSLEFVTMIELKKPIQGGLQLFPFYLVVPYSVCFLLEFEATSHNAMFVGRWGKCTIRNGVAFFCRVDIQFTYRFNK